MGQKVNIERCLKIGDRLDGHMVQGHIDDTIKCSSIVEEGGSWRIGFQGLNINSKLIVNKGSICINGVSLTVVKEEILFRSGNYLRIHMKILISKN